MRIFFLIIFAAVLFPVHSSFSAPLNGQVEEEAFLKPKTGLVVDSATGRPIPNASVSIPSKGISAKTDNFGKFSFGVAINGPSILSVQAEGYKPFSVTATQDSFKGPMTLEISKQSGREIVIDSSLHHLGDDNFSNLSADAGNFKTKSSGPLFSKGFSVQNINKNEKTALKIGSILGIDTLLAKKLSQNKITTSYSSPTSVYINSQKVGELRINGDNQEIAIPPYILRPNSYNEISIETGYNLFSKRRDFDDMEFMNLILELR